MARRHTHYHLHSSYVKTKPLHVIFEFRFFRVQLQMLLPKQLDFCCCVLLLACPNGILRSIRTRKTARREGALWGCAQKHIVSLKTLKEQVLGNDNRVLLLLQSRFLKGAVYHFFAHRKTVRRQQTSTPSLTVSDPVVAKPKVNLLQHSSDPCFVSLITHLLNPWQAERVD